MKGSSSVTLRSLPASGRGGGARGGRPHPPRLAAGSARRGVGAGGQAREAVEACAPQQVQEDGLGLIVGRVTGEDVGGERGMASGPGTSLEIGPRLDERGNGAKGGALAPGAGRAPPRLRPPPPPPPPVPLDPPERP